MTTYVSVTNLYVLHRKYIGKGKLKYTLSKTLNYLYY